MKKKDTRDRREYKKAYAELNKEKIKEKNKKYYQINSDKLKAYSKKYVEENRESVSTSRKTYYESHKEEIAQKAKIQHSVLRITQYGITVEEYNDMFQRQDGRCAICKTHQSETSGKLHIDHNHETGRVRGLLCGKCNKALGLFGDNKSMLQSAYDYLGEDNEN